MSEIKGLEYYLDLPYTIVLRRDEDGDTVAQIPELPGCSDHGANPGEALENLEETKKLWIAHRIKAGLPIPEPEPEEDLPSGKWVQRVPRTLHQRLTKMAKREQVSLNQLVTSMLSEAVVASPVRELLKHCVAIPLPLHRAWEGSNNYGHWSIHAPIISEAKLGYALTNALTIAAPSKKRHAYNPQEIFSSPKEATKYVERLSTR